MQTSVIRHYLLPLLQWLVGMIVLAFLIDWLLHWLNIFDAGRYLGLAGLCLILISFMYSFRKRKFIKTGSPHTLLLWHELLSLTGSALILVHAGVHYHALLPWLAVGFLLINVISGITGKYLLKKSILLLASRETTLVNEGYSEAEIRKIIFWDATAVRVMKQWRTVHIPFALLLASLVIVHIVSVLIFGS